MRFAHLLSPFLSAFAHRGHYAGLCAIDMVISCRCRAAAIAGLCSAVDPTPGYLWVPGYWAWDNDIGYYWVPGTWVLPPEPEHLDARILGLGRRVLRFSRRVLGTAHRLLWRSRLRFRLRWRRLRRRLLAQWRFFLQPNSQQHLKVAITNVYSKTIIINNRTNVSFNGGAGGTTTKPTPEQLAIAQEHHVAATANQTRHAQEAAKDPALSLANNHGHPTVAATCVLRSSKAQASLPPSRVSRSQRFLRKVIVRKSRSKEPRGSRHHHDSSRHQPEPA